MLRVDMAEAHRSCSRSRLVHVLRHISFFHICRPNIPRKRVDMRLPYATILLPPLLARESLGLPDHCYTRSQIEWLRVSHVQSQSRHSGADQSRLQVLCIEDGMASFACGHDAIGSSRWVFSCLRARSLQCFDIAVFRGHSEMKSDDDSLEIVSFHMGFCVRCQCAHDCNHKRGGWEEEEVWSGPCM